MSYSHEVDLVARSVGEDELVVLAIDEVDFVVVAVTVNKVDLVVRSEDERSTVDLIVTSVDEVDLVVEATRWTSSSSWPRTRSTSSSDRWTRSTSSSWSPTRSTSSLGLWMRLNPPPGSVDKLDLVVRSVGTRSTSCTATRRRSNSSSWW